MKHLSKRFVAFSLALSIGVGLLSGCGTTSQSPATPLSSASEPSTAPATINPNASQLGDEEILKLIEDAYTFCYPLITVEVTKQVLTNVPEPLEIGYAPLNQFGHKGQFPDPSFKEVVRVNLDTMYSQAFVSVKDEPQVMSLPNMTDRYYLMPMLDAWSEVIASPGTRETGSEAGDYLITGPGWNGTVPDGMTQIKSPTDTVWIVGRTMVYGPDDMPNAKAQAQYKLTPLSAWGTNYVPPKNVPNDSIPKTPPKKRVNEMPLDEYFNMANQLMVNNPPHEADSDFIRQLEQINVGPGKKFSSTVFSDGIQQKLKTLPEKMVNEWLTTDYSQFERVDDNWGYSLLRGRFGTNYLYRAYITLVAFGTNVPEDAIYPNGLVDQNGNVLNGANKYAIHFEKDQLPPTNAFWSLTLYGTDGYLTENAANKYLIRNSEVQYNEDGSLDLYIQHDSVEDHKKSNWLPAPKDDFTLHLRVYWPKESALKGNWDIPPLVKVS